MNLEDTQQLFAAGALICAFGTILNLFMLKKRGTSAGLMAAAFLFLGVASLLYSKGFSPLVAMPLALITLALLIVDFILRMRKLGGR